MVLALFLCAFGACKKTENTPTPPNDGNQTDTALLGAPVGKNISGEDPGFEFAPFITYLIRAGNNYCDNNVYTPLTTKGLKFKVIFDSSCIYTTVDPNNQADINKLYGFADNNSLHQANSARFGWNWMNGQMYLHAYCYVNTVRMYKELGTVALNKEVECALDVLPGKYIFTVNGKRDTMMRESMDTVAVGYKLLPYFGGDEPAPHDIRIQIKEL